MSQRNLVFSMLICDYLKQHMTTNKTTKILLHTLQEHFSQKNYKIIYFIECGSLKYTVYTTSANHRQFKCELWSQSLLFPSYADE